jgi:hypothetical protein
MAIPIAIKTLLLLVCVTRMHREAIAFLVLLTPPLRGWYPEKQDLVAWKDKGLREIAPSVPVPDPVPNGFDTGATLSQPTLPTSNR